MKKWGFKGHLRRALRVSGNGSAVKGANYEVRSVCDLRVKGDRGQAWNVVANEKNGDTEKS